MKFSLPKVVDIQTEMAGRTIKGSFYEVLGDLVVNYNGRTASVKKPKTHLHEVALELFQKLVQEHYVPISAIPGELPEPMREAALEYVNSMDEDESVRALILSFGEFPIGSRVHQQVSWLCVNSLHLIVPFCKWMCGDDGPERILASMIRWLKDPSYPLDWESARRPLEARLGGVKIEDCDACRVEPIAQAVACCADYMQTANIDSAVKTLLSAWGAHAEGAWPPDQDQPFELWLVQIALPHAYRCEPDFSTTGWE